MTNRQAVTRIRLWTWMIAVGYSHKWWIYETILIKYELLKNDQQRNRRLFCAELREITFLTVSTSRNITISIG